MKHSKVHLIELSTLHPSSDSLRIGELSAAYSFCRRIASSHYENFPVGSLLIEKKHRPHFYSVYAFARLADDIGDEYDFTPAERLELLNCLLANLKAVVGGDKSSNPILLATANSIKERQIPLQVFENLLLAFKMDSEFKPPETWDDVYRYCSYSANPVGELVLYITGEFSAPAKKHSDEICTALQLINFWQDFSRDLTKSRLYIPKQLLDEYAVSAEELIAHPDTISKQKLEDLSLKLNQESERLLREGSEIIGFIQSNRLKAELSLICLSAKVIIDQSKKLGAELFFQRPKLKKIDFLKNIPKVSLILLGLKKSLNFK